MKLHLIAARGSVVILPILLIVVLSLSAVTAYAAVKSGFVENNIKKPVITAIDNFFKALTEPSKESSPEAGLESTKEASPAENPKDTVKTGTSRNNNIYYTPYEYNYKYQTPSQLNLPSWGSLPKYSTPNYSFPTPAPGEIGSPQWKADFDKKIQDFQNSFKSTQQDQKDFCQKYSTPSNPLTGC